MSDASPTQKEFFDAKADAARALKRALEEASPEERAELGRVLAPKRFCLVQRTDESDRLLLQLNEAVESFLQDDACPDNEIPSGRQPPFELLVKTIGHIVGLQYHDGRTSEDGGVVLVPEPDHAHDGNAISVHDHMPGQAGSWHKHDPSADNRVGYVWRHHAAALAGLAGVPYNMPDADRFFSFESATVCSTVPKAKAINPEDYEGDVDEDLSKLHIEMTVEVRGRANVEIATKLQRYLESCGMKVTPSFLNWRVRQAHARVVEEDPEDPAHRAIRDTIARQPVAA